MKLSFGVSAGVSQFAIDASKITLRDEGDQVLSNAKQFGKLARQIFTRQPQDKFLGFGRGGAGEQRFQLFK